MPEPADYGVNVGGGVFDPTKVAQFVVDHPDWEGVGEPGGMSYEAGILAWDAGLPPPTEWVSLMVEAEGAKWWVDVETANDGNFSIPLAFPDVAWNYFDAASWYDYDRDKDIDTGEASGP